MKKRYILIISLILALLSLSCISAAENDTATISEVNDDMVEINEDNSDTIAISVNNDSRVSIIEDEKLSISNSNDSLKSEACEDNTILSVSESENVLSSTVTPTLASSSSSYQTPTKKQKTFTIGGFKAVLSNSQYKKLYRASSIEDIFFDYGYSDYYYVGEKFRGYGISGTGLYCYITVKTNKFIKVKVKVGNKIKYKKTRAYMIFTYGGGQCGIAYRYMIFLDHKYNNPGYDYSKVIGSNAKYFSKCRCSTSFTKLKSSKLTNKNYVYKRFGI